MIYLLLVRGRPCGEITFAMSPWHADLRGLGRKCVCVAPYPYREDDIYCYKRGASLVNGIIGGII